MEVEKLAEELKVTIIGEGIAEGVGVGGKGVADKNKQSNISKGLGMATGGKFGKFMKGSVAMA